VQALDQRMAALGKQETLRIQQALADGAWHELEALRPGIPDAVAEEYYGLTGSIIDGPPADQRRWARGMLIHRAADALVAEGVGETRGKVGKRDIRLLQVSGATPLAASPEETGEAGPGPSPLPRPASPVNKAGAGAGQKEAEPAPIREKPAGAPGPGPEDPGTGARPRKRVGRRSRPRPTAMPPWPADRPSTRSSRPSSRPRRLRSAPSWNTTSWRTSAAPRRSPSGRGRVSSSMGTPGSACASSTASPTTSWPSTYPTAPPP
jgi:hypothetical protein